MIYWIFRLVDEITFKKAADANDSVTVSAVLGPSSATTRQCSRKELLSSMGFIPNGEITYMHGIVTDLKTKKVISGAWIDVWQS